MSFQVLHDVHAGKYIHGVAVHWYMDSFVPAELSLGTTHHIYPEYYLFGTEACAGWSPIDRGVKLGSWDRAEEYAHDIIEVRSSYLLNEGHACSVRSAVTQARLDEPWAAVERWVTSLHAAVQVYKLHAAAHALQKLPAGHQSKLELVFCFSYSPSPSQGKLDSFHSIHFAWLWTYWESRGICLVDVLWHLNTKHLSTDSLDETLAAFQFRNTNDLLNCRCSLSART